MPKILIIDDEIDFLEALSERLILRGYHSITLPSGNDAIKILRNDYEIDVVILDLNMPGISGKDLLKEIKKYRPAVQVIVLTGYGDTQTAVEAGRLKAFDFLQKPCKIDVLIERILAAREQRVHDLQKHEVPPLPKVPLKKWLMGYDGSRPGVIILGALLFLLILALPAPQLLVDILTQEKTGSIQDLAAGYSDYSTLNNGQSIAEYYSIKFNIGETIFNEDGTKTFIPEGADSIIFKAKIMLGVLLLAVMFWASGALPIGIVSILIAVMMYFFGVMKPNAIAESFLKDSVIFIFGVLAFAKAITATGLDRRIALLLLGRSHSIKSYIFFYLPALAVVCSFLSEHALLAFVTPISVMIYMTAIKGSNLKQDRQLAIVLFLTLCLSTNMGGPGSPAAGGRNAVMMGILSDYGMAPSFGQWVMYGMPFVPVMAGIVSVYFYLICYKKIKVKEFRISDIVKSSAKELGPMNKREYTTLFALVVLVIMWLTISADYGMGGPVLLIIVFLNFARILKWRDVARIPWEVIALYAAATAMGKGLAITGSALFLAHGFLNILPDFFRNGEGLAIAASFFTGIVTNFMSDGATVSTIGPITVPMATISGTHPWMVGFATAFASSFANMLVIGTPGNAIVYSLAKNPDTGEHLIKLKDFLIYGSGITVLSFIVLWFWTILGYWQWIGFP